MCARALVCRTHWIRCNNDCDTKDGGDVCYSVTVRLCINHSTSSNARPIDWLRGAWNALHNTHTHVSQTLLFKLMKSFFASFFVRLENKCVIVVVVTVAVAVVGRSAVAKLKSVDSPSMCIINQIRVCLAVNTTHDAYVNVRMCVRD